MMKRSPNCRLSDAPLYMLATDHKNLWQPRYHISIDLRKIDCGITC